MLGYFLKRFAFFTVFLFLLVLGLETIKQGYSEQLLHEAWAWGVFGGLLVASMNTRNRQQRQCRACEVLDTLKS